MNTNSENPNVGKKFQDLTAELLKDYYSIDFIPEQEIDIGNPPKKRKFDLASKDGLIVVECKCYVWTKGNNNPSAKMATLNEAVLYFKLLSRSCKKILVMKKSIRSKTGESLASYYLRRYSFVLDGITVIEVDTDAKAIAFIKE